MDPVTLEPTIEVCDAHVRRADGILRKLRHLLTLKAGEARAYAKTVARRLGEGATLDAEACILSVPVARLFTDASPGGVAVPMLRVSFGSGAATAPDQREGSRRRSRSADSSSSRSGDTDASGPSSSEDDDASAPPPKKRRLPTLLERARNAFLAKPVVDAFVYALGEHLGEANAALARALDEADLTSKRRKPPRQVPGPDAPGDKARKAVHAVAVQALGAAWTLHRASLVDFSTEARDEALETLVQGLAAEPVQVLRLPAVSGVYHRVLGCAPPAHLPVSPCSACRQLGCAACRAGGGVGGGGAEGDGGGGSESEGVSSDEADGGSSGEADGGSSGEDDGSGDSKVDAEEGVCEKEDGEGGGEEGDHKGCGSEDGEGDAEGEKDQGAGEGAGGFETGDEGDDPGEEAAAPLQARHAADNVYMTEDDES